MEDVKTICSILMVMAFLPLQIQGFSFLVKPVGTGKVTATPGELLTYNAHITVSNSTPLSFHVSLPYFVTPIINVEKIEVSGIGQNLELSQVETYAFYQEDSNSFNSRSQSSVDLGNITRNISAGAGPGDNVVVQVQARLLNHTNVTTGKVFWLYFGMHYQNDAVWVIGKSVKAEVLPGPAKMAVTLKFPTDPLYKVEMQNFEIEVDIFHLPDSKSSASEMSIALSFPDYLGTPNIQSDAAPAYGHTVAGTIVTITFTESFKVGQRAQLRIGMTYTPGIKGQYVDGNIYGSFQYTTADENNCAKTVKKKEDLQLGFSIYSTSDTCDSKILNLESFVTASSALLPCCPAVKSFNHFAASNDNLGWEPWSDGRLRLADEFIQMNFQKKTTVNRIRMTGSNKKKFVRSIYISYSQNGVHWQYVTDMGEKKEFEATSSAATQVYVLPSVSGWFLRVHVVKRSPAGAGVKMRLYGCEDDAAVKAYEVYQRGFIAHSNEIILLCNVHPDRTQAKPNCYLSPDLGSRWDAIHPSVVNVIGYDASAKKIYGMGVTSKDTPVYMMIESPQSVRTIAKTDWDAVKSSVTTPTIIPLLPVNGDSLTPIPSTNVHASSYIFNASPAGLLKTEGQNTRMIASWSEYKEV